MSRTAAFLFATTALVVATPGFAAGAAPAEDGTIVVTASGIDQPIEQVGQAITVITADEISQRQSVFVSDLLATAPGVAFSRNGGVGGVTTVRIRGAEGEQTLVLIDGVRVNDPSSPGGAYDFANLVTGNIDRIEVLRGPNSVIWGSQALGGVVDVRTVAPSDRFKVNGRAEYGYSDTARTSANVSGTMGAIAGSIGGSYFRTDGISSFAGGSERDGFRHYGANAKLLFTLSDTLSLDLRGFYSDGKADVDGFAPPLFNFGDTRETQRTQQFVGYAGVNLALLDGRFRNRLSFSYTDIDRHNADRDATPTTTFDGKGRIEQYAYQGVFDAADALTLVFGAEHERSRLRTASPSSFDPNPMPTRGRTSMDSFYGQAILRPIEGLTVTGGVRYDDHDQFGGETTVGGNFAYSPNKGRTVLRGTYAEGFKAPTLFQLQSEYGNVTLQPETAKSYDIGIEQHVLSDQLVASLTYFQRRTRNQIDFIFCGTNSGICQNRPFGTYDNIARTRADGVEFELQVHPAEGFDVRAQYSYTDTENRSRSLLVRGNDLPRRPKNTVSVLADYRFPFGLSLGTTILHVGDRFDNAANSVRLDGYVLVDVRASFPLGHGIELYGRVENLFDTDYVTVSNYGTIGRAAYGGVRFAL